MANCLNRSSLGLILLVGLAGLLAGCSDDSERPTKRGAEKKAPAKQSIKGTPVQVGPNVYLELLPDGRRRVLISSYICRWEAQLEELLTRKGTKEHESILAAEIDARHVHLALETAKAVPGEPVRFSPKFRPPSGTTIKVSLRYTKDNEEITIPAQKWIRNTKTGKELDSDWVFAGSKLVDNPLDPKAPPRYLANAGDVICVINMPDALLDLPIRSDPSNPELGGRDFEVWTDRLPPKPKDENEKVVVVVILEPVLKKQLK